MFLEIVIALVLGVCAGIVTGLIPGIHVNLVSVTLLSLSAWLLGFTNPFVLAVFIIAMSVTHTFIDSIPSIFLGAPDAAMALGVLPGHKMLLEGKGYEAVKLTVIGSFLSLLGVLLVIPLMIPIVPLVYGFIQPLIGWLLVAVVVYMVFLKEKTWLQKGWAFAIFLLSGILGYVVLNMPLEQPLFSLLSGLFGVSALVLSLQESSSLPTQTFEETVTVDVGTGSKALGAAIFSGSVTGLLPGLGSAQAAILGMQLVGDMGMYGFMILVGGINTVNFVFSLVTLYTLEKARNGAVVAVLQIVESIGLVELIVLLLVALVVGCSGVFLALKISKLFANVVSRVNYHLLCWCIIGLLFVMSVLFDGFLGIGILLTSTGIGLLAPLVGVKRSSAMGCILLPVIVFFLL